MKLVERLEVIDRELFLAIRLLIKSKNKFMPNSFEQKFKNFDCDNSNSRKRERESYKIIVAMLLTCYEAPLWSLRTNTQIEPFKILNIFSFGLK